MRKFRWARWARADILTLIGIVVAVVGVVVAYFAIPDEDKVEPELRTRDKESAAFQLGQAKVLYTQIELTLQYRLQTKADPDWINNPKVEQLKVRMANLLTTTRHLYCILDESPCSISDDATWSKIYENLDTMLRRQYVRRIQNAYHIGEIVSIFQIETTVKPAEHNVDLPILAEEARGAATIWVRRTILTIWVGTKILLPDNEALRESVRALYDLAALPLSVRILIV